MAYENVTDRLVSMVANADLSTKQYFLVKAVDASGTAKAALCDSTANELPLGVLQNKPTSGQAAEIATAGTTKVVVGAAGIVAGNKVTADAAGKAVAASAADEFIIGVALQTSATVDSIVPMLLLSSGRGA